MKLQAGVVGIALVLLAAVPASGRWRHVGLSGKKILSVANAYSRDICYAAGESKVYVVENRGAWIDTIFEYGPSPGIHVCVRTPSWEEDKVLLAWGWGSRSDGLWFSDDRGASWRVVHWMMFPNALAVSRYDPDFLMLGSDTLNGGLFRSVDAGSTWVECDSGLGTRLVRCLAIEESHSDSFVLCGTRGHGTYLSTDRGISWVRCSPDTGLDVRGCDMVRRSGDSVDLYVSGEGSAQSGIWCSTDLGATWEHELALTSPREIGNLVAVSNGDSGVHRKWGDWSPDCEGLTDFDVHCLCGAGFWYVGTDDGVFHADDTPGTGENPEGEEPRGCLGTPSIARGVLQIDARGAETRGAIRLLDIAGREVMPLRPGENDIRHIAPGVYFIPEDSSTQGAKGSSRRIVVQR